MEGSNCSAKHGKRNNWRTKTSTTSHGVGPWQHISKLGNGFFGQVSFKAGNGLNISFWKDKWLYNTPLMEEYPNLFQIAQDKNSSSSKQMLGTAGVFYSEDMFRIGK